jgi:hypothetical protein
MQSLRQEDAVQYVDLTVGARVEIYGMVYPMERGHGPIHTS